MKQMNFKFDNKTVSLINQLKGDFDLKTNAAVIRRALAILKIASIAKKDGAELIIRQTNEGIVAEKLIIIN